MKLHPIVTLASVAVASTAFSATVPYADSFQSSSTAGWITAGAAPATWSIANNGSTNVYQAASSSTNGSFSSVQQFTNIDSALEDFTFTTHFKISDTSNGLAVGFAAFGNTSGLGSYYLADINAAGSMRIISLGGTNADFTTNGPISFGANLNGTANYTMSVSGTYVGSTLNLSFEVSNGTTTKTVTASDATPLTGQYFGLRLNNSIASTDVAAVQFADFTATTSAVPEPASFAALAGFGALGLAAFGRRRRAS